MRRLVACMRYRTSCSSPSGMPVRGGLRHPPSRALRPDRVPGSTVARAVASPSAPPLPSSSGSPITGRTVWSGRPRLRVPRPRRIPSTYRPGLRRRRRAIPPSQLMRPSRACAIPSGAPTGTSLDDRDRFSGRDERIGPELSRCRTMVHPRLTNPLAKQHHGSRDMSNVSKKLRGFLRSSRAVSALEYAILVGVVGVALVAAVGTFTGQITAALTRIGTDVAGILP